MLHCSRTAGPLLAARLSAAVYLNNRLPSKATGNCHTIPALARQAAAHRSHPRTFGCLAYALVASGPRQAGDRATTVHVRRLRQLDSSRTYLLWDNQQHKLVRSGQVHFVESIIGWNYNPRATAAQQGRLHEQGRQQQGRNRSADALDPIAARDSQPLAASIPTLSHTCPTSP